MAGAKKKKRKKPASRQTVGTAKKVLKGRQAQLKRLMKQAGA